MEALRVMQILFFSYSIIYFFVLIKTENEHLNRLAGVMMLLWNFLCLGGGGYYYWKNMESKCNET